MNDTLRMEAERIRTLAPVWMLALLAVVLGAVVSAFLATTPDRGALSADTTRSVITGGASGSLVPFVGLPLLFLGVATILEDTRYKLATVLLVAQPRRSTLMLARLLVLAAIAVPVGLAQMLLCAVIALALGRTPQIAEVPQIALPYLLSLVVFTWIGAALGWLTGTAAAPVGLVLLELLLLEPLAKVAGTQYSETLETWAERLPFTSARDALALEIMPMGRSAGYALALLFAAWLAVRNRDY